jgi:hypothetical protein
MYSISLWVDFGYYYRCLEGATEFCVGDKAENNRFYSVKVGVADGNNATAVHDTCRVVVMPKAETDSKQEQLRGHSIHRLSKSEEEKLARASSKSFLLASTLFRTRVDLN